jgi:hypothetical protein
VLHTSSFPLWFHISSSRIFFFLYTFYITCFFFCKMEA